MWIRRVFWDSEKKPLRWLKRISVIFVGTLTLIVLFIAFNPRPVSYFLNQNFVGGVEVEAEGYEEVKQNIELIENIDYNSEYDNGTLDLIKHQDSPPDAPVIFWIHGGAFVGGDKKDVEKYTSMVASNGYHIVNINYGLAPDVKYPAPLIQIEEAYKHVKENAEAYGLNLDRVYFAGDSAGAQLAAQFVSIQLNEDFSPTAGIDQLVPADSIRGAILLCGPYDLIEVATESKSPISNFIFKRVGWGYFGKYNWEGLAAAEEASLLDNQPETFVPTFITDGNTASFESQGKRFAEYLSGVTDVTQVFYDVEEAELLHEYQFQMNLEQSVRTYELLLDYLDETDGTQ